MNQAKPSVLGVIPARSGSKGIPDKNVRLLAGRPLLHYTCDAARGSNTLSRVIVSTNCPRIAEVAREAGAEVPFLRPPELATDRTPMIDVIRHLDRWLEDEGTPPEILVLLQPTAPFRLPQHIDEAVQRLLEGGHDSVVSVVAVPTHFHPRWQFAVHEGRMRVFTGEPLGQIVSRRQDLEDTYIRNGAIYAFRRRVLDETGTLYGRDCAAYVMPAEQSINLDTMDDWHQAEAFLKNRNCQDAAA